jgi:hypothetical protein
MFVILTSRPGQYHTEPNDAYRVCETYDYMFCGQNKARFTIAALLREAKVRVVDETPPQRVNEIPSKILPRFETIEAARAELRSLTKFSGIDAVLRPVQ